jgi:hypothetical protein
MGMGIVEVLGQKIRDIPDFPQKSIVFKNQWSRQKSGRDSAVSFAFVTAGMIFHPSRVQSALLHHYIEQAFVELTRLPACPRENLWFLALSHA